MLYSSLDRRAIETNIIFIVPKQYLLVDCTDYNRHIARQGGREEPLHFRKERYIAAMPTYA